MAAICAATPAHAIDPGCYPADVVRNATWNAEGPEKQYTVISGDRNTDTHNKNFFTSSADGSVGYNIENSGTGHDDGKLCVKLKYMDINLNASAQRPSWVKVPAGSRNDIYISGQERDYGVRVIFGATTVIRKADGQEYRGPQLLVTKAGKLVEGMVTGAALTNNRQGDGDNLMYLANLRTNANFDKMAVAGATPKAVNTTLALK